jgi:hypothetical protein
MIRGKPLSVTTMTLDPRARRLSAPVPSLLAALALLVTSCGRTTPSALRVDFEVSVVGEIFVMRTSDPETIRLARENQAGRVSHFPIGPLRRGNGGFNAPWSWHLDPREVRMTEAAIEVCDGRPSYVEGHLADYPTYCPWGARIVGER